MNDLPVEMLLVVGVTVLGAAGVLLAAWDPTSTANVPELATVLNWLRSNVKLAEALPALATCHTRHVSSYMAMSIWVLSQGVLALMNVAPELDLRVMLQCNVPPWVGSVLGRYWSPRLVANSCDE